MSYGYPPYGYQPSYGTTNYMQRGLAPQTPQMPQAPQVQPQAPQMPMGQPNISRQVPQIQDCRHGTEDEIRAHIVYPDCVAYFIDYPKNRLYAKTADASGISNIAYFDIIPINADGSPIKPQEPTPQVNFEDFVKVEQLKEYGFITYEEHKKVLNELETIKKMLAAKPQAQKGGNN